MSALMSFVNFTEHCFFILKIDVLLPRDSKIVLHMEKLSTDLLFLPVPKANRKNISIVQPDTFPDGNQI